MGNAEGKEDEKMDGTAYWRKREAGEVEIRESISPLEDGAKSIRKSVYLWSLPYQIERYALGIKLAFTCLEGQDGQRRFKPHGELEDFLYVAGYVGHIFLDDQGKLPTNQPFNLHEQRLLSCYVKSRREYLRRTRNLADSLTIPKSARASGSEEDRSILPSTLGLDRDGAGPRWTIERLMEEGRQEAEQAGKANPLKDESVCFGLYRAAKLAPLLVHDEAMIASLMYMALFSLGPATESASDEARSFVANEFKKILREREKYSTEQFNTWVQDSKTDVIHRISKLKKCPTNRAGVRQIFLELGMDAFKAQAKCLDAAFRAFKKAIPEPLTETESRLFDMTYLAQPQFAGFPLTFIYDRFEFCRQPIVDIWDDPENETPVHVLYRMLTYFNEMLESLRAAERLSKELKSPEGKVTGREEYSEELNLQKNTPLSAELKERLQTLIERRLKLDLEFHDWDCKDAEVGSRCVTVRVQCAELGVDCRLTFAHSELREE